jgi:hypothetical protein
MLSVKGEAKNKSPPMSHDYLRHLGNFTLFIFEYIHLYDNQGIFDIKIEYFTIIYKLSFYLSLIDRIFMQ